MSDCIFCKIANNQIPAEKLYEDDQVLAFMDLKPVSKGHLLIIPKNHSDDILETSTDDANALISRAKIFGAAVITGLGADGFNIGINTKPAAGQVVFHTHIHVIPRYQNDALKMWPNLDEPPEPLTVTAEKIRLSIK